MMLMHQHPIIGRKAWLNLRHVFHRWCIADIDILRPLKQGKVCQLVDLLQVLYTLASNQARGKR